MLPGLLASLALIAVHLFCHKLRFLDGLPRSRWLSAAGGISVAYVFLHLLPELAQGQREIEQHLPSLAQFLGHHSYLMAFVGLCLFYGAEQAVKRSRRSGQTDIPAPGVYWLHLFLFALYNMLVGYLLRDAQRDAEELALFCFAMGLHFLVTDYGLREHYKHRFAQSGRWVLCASILIGWITAEALTLPEVAPSLFTAVLGGGVIFNVLKEELPEERSSRFGAFLMGGVGYAAVLLSLA